MKILSAIRQKAAAHKILSLVAVIILIAALGAGGWFFWENYQYRQTSAYAVEKLKGLLNPPDRQELAKIVDFTAISHDLAVPLAKNFPFFLDGSDQQRNISHQLQTALLRKLMTKEEPKRAAKEPEDEEKLLNQELVILPEDFLAQFIASSSLHETGPDSAMLSAKIESPQLKRTFHVVLRMAKTHAGWKINGVANAGELVAQLREAMLERHAKLHDVYAGKNQATLKRMDQILPIQSCTADAGLLSDGKTMLMIVQVIARNKGETSVSNFNVDATISNSRGQPLVQRFLNAARPVAPGEDFNHRWTFELDSHDPLAQTLLRNRPLRCSASWQTLNLGSGQVLHMVEVPNPDRQCSIAGHDHPEGFCKTPVFLPLR